MKSWVITIPKLFPWEDYARELHAVRDGKSILNYRVWVFPHDLEVNDRCYVLYDGHVRGWMNIVGCAEYTEEWECSVTGKTWPPGRYIQRSGPFHPVTDSRKMRGFRGIRPYTPPDMTEDTE